MNNTCCFRSYTSPQTSRKLFHKEKQYASRAAAVADDGTVPGPAIHTVTSCAYLMLLHVSVADDGTVPGPAIHTVTSCAYLMLLHVSVADDGTVPGPAIHTLAPEWTQNDPNRYPKARVGSPCQAGTTFTTIHRLTLKLSPEWTQNDPNRYPKARILPMLYSHDPEEIHLTAVLAVLCCPALLDPPNAVQP
ncbi:hypothetical protein RRG08_058887 [Elysia crispata]|uniref:Uncharacterized protein n=1 Tax=Elysia crispata TaxID=231223 RepID=A0AAE1CQI6_9GAST|nr:hypothetical protein RRG08_058887 [Elysia crispata]